jgi:hypothetical protein
VPSAGRRISAAVSEEHTLDTSRDSQRFPGTFSIRILQLSGTVATAALATAAELSNMSAAKKRATRDLLRIVENPPSTIDEPIRQTRAQLQRTTTRRTWDNLRQSIG